MKKKLSGSIYLEAILAIVVFSMIILAVIPLLSFMIRRTERSKYEPQAALILQEATEAAYNILISSEWNRYSNETEYQIQSGNKWSLRTGKQTGIETRYTRSIVFSRACRDTNGFYIPKKDLPNGQCPYQQDINSRVITTTVEWEEAGIAKKLSEELLVLNLKQ